MVETTSLVLRHVNEYSPKVSFHLDIACSHRLWETRHGNPKGKTMVSVRLELDLREFTPTGGSGSLLATMTEGGFASFLTMIVGGLFVGAGSTVGSAEGVRLRRRLGSVAGARVGRRSRLALG